MRFAPSLVEEVDEVDEIDEVKGIVKSSDSLLSNLSRIGHTY